MDKDSKTEGGRIRELEKENRLLAKKLARSERDRLNLEETNERKESLLRKVIQELRESQISLEERRQVIESLRKAQAQLVQNEKMSSLGQLVAGIAHEINNPVNFIYGNLDHVDEYTSDLLDLIQTYREYYPHPPEILQKKLDRADVDFLVDDLSKIVASMRVGANRIREIVLSLRNFSRLDEAECKVVDIHEGIENTLLILRHRLKSGASRRSIEIVKDYGDLPKIECYPGQLNQVFMNLVTNAIDALEEVEIEQHIQKSVTPGVISIQTSLLGDRDWISIKISDNGPGIPEDVRSKLFDPFFTTKPIGKGTGLGLSISYQIVTEKHRGKLLCDSEWRKGTTFTVEIPIHQSSTRDEAIFSLPQQESSDLVGWE